MDPITEAGLSLTRRRFFARGAHPLGWAALSALTGSNALADAGGGAVVADRGLSSRRRRRRGGILRGGVVLLRHLVGFLGVHARIRGRIGGRIAAALTAPA